MLKGSTSLKAALRRRKGEPKGTGGVDDRGAAEEDGPVTWETPEVHSGVRATEDRRPPPTRRRHQAVRRPACEAAMPEGTEPTLEQMVRHGRGKTGGVPKRQGSRMAAYER